MQDSNYTVTCEIGKAAPISCNTEKEAIAAYNEMIAADCFGIEITANTGYKYDVFRNELVEVSPSDY